MSLRGENSKNAAADTVPKAGSLKFPDIRNCPLLVRTESINTVETFTVMVSVYNIPISLGGVMPTSLGGSQADSTTALIIPKKTARPTTLRVLANQFIVKIVVCICEIFVLFGHQLEFLLG